MNLPFYTRIALLGLALYLSFVVLLFILALALQPSEWEYPLIVGGIAVALALPIYFWRPWGLIVGIAGGLVGVAFSMDSFGENVTSPDSFLNFAYQPVFALAGTILLLGGSSAGLVQHFRKRTSVEGPRLVSKAVLGLLGGVAILSVFSAVLTFASVDSVSATEKAGATTVTAVDFEFDIAAIQARAGGDTRFVIRNRDFIVHTFTIDTLDIDLKLGPRGEKLVQLRSPSPGTYEFRCKIAGHESMRGTLTVE